MLITDQVATAPCTDPVQAHFLTFEAKPFLTIRCGRPLTRLDRSNNPSQLMPPGPRLESRYFLTVLIHPAPQRAESSCLF